MNNRREQRARSRFVTSFVLILFVCFYLFLQGEQGKAVHVSRDERFLYLSMGEYGSFQVYEFRNPRPQPQPGMIIPVPGDANKIHTYAIPLEKSQLKLFQPTSEPSIRFGDVSQSVVQGNILYVVNPNQGLILYDIQTREAPVEIARYDFYDIRDLVFFEQIAFIAAGKSGIYIVDLSQPGSIEILGHYDTAGSAEAVFPAFINFGELSIDTSAENGQIQEQITRQYLVFVADGNAGYVILDFMTGERVPREMTLLRAENTPGYVYDINFRDSYLFLADGEGGIRIFDIFSGGFDPANPTFLGVFDTPGPAYQIAFQRNLIYIADGEAGLIIADLNSLPQTHNLTNLGAISFPAKVTSLVVSKDVAVLCGGRQGTFVVDVSDPANLILKNNLPTPGLASVSQIVSALMTGDTGSAKVSASLWDMLKEMSFGFGVFLLAVLAIVPGVLPQVSFGLALNTIFLFIRFLAGKAGQVVQVENGEMKTDPLQQDHAMKRPLILDNASAGLIQAEQASLRIAGPGTSDLLPGEALVKTIDLRPRTYIFGPADEDPFEPQQEHEEEIMARHRVRRRMETQAFSQDGVEVVPNVIVDFRVKSLQHSNAAPFGFHPGYALQALRKEYAADKTFTEGHHSGSLNHLPGELAVKAWREILQCFTLDELFSPVGGHETSTNRRFRSGFEYVVDWVNQVLKNPFADEIGLHGQATGIQVFSEAFNELEQAGLEVMRVWIVNPRIEPDAGNEFVSRKLSAWHANIQDFQQLVQAKYTEIDAENKQHAQVDFAKSSIRSLAEGMQRYQSLPENYLFLNQSLYLLLRGTRSLSRLAPAEKDQLDQLLEWLESNLEM